jgi:hypothetical protein
MWQDPIEDSLVEIQDDFSWLDDPSIDWELTPIYTIFQKAWIDILQMPPAPEYTSKFVMKGRRSAIQNSEIPAIKHRKRRRKDSIEKFLRPIGANMTLGPVIVQVQLANSVDDACQRVVDALAGILPLDVKMNIFGFWHSVILVAVFYRHDNLCWVLLNRANYNLYISAHFVADSLHLFTAVRHHLQLSEGHKIKKWTRQGVSDIMCFFKNIDAMKQNKSVKLNTLPRGVLRFGFTKNSLDEVNEFLRGTGSGGHLMRNFIRKQPLPPGYDPLTRQLTDSTRGWKVFKRSSSQGCKGRIKIPCTCDLIGRQLVQGGISDMTDTDAALRIMTVLPTSLDKLACGPLKTHFSHFISYVKENPNRIYFPIQDEYV